MQFQINVFAWIPLAEVPNPIASLPGGTGAAVTIPHYFAEASGRRLAAIAIGQTDPLRRLRW